MEQAGTLEQQVTAGRVNLLSGGATVGNISVICVFCCHIVAANEAVCFISIHFKQIPTWGFFRMNANFHPIAKKKRFVGIL